MIVTLSERKVSELVKQLEGLEDQTIEEITERMPHYAARLFSHVFEDYRLRFVGLASLRGQIADFRFSLETSDMETITAGLQFMNPVCVSVEQGDIARLVPDRVIGPAMQSCWSEYEARLQRITPGELAPIITDLSWKAVGGRLGAPAAPPTEQGYQEWLRQNGLVDPAAKSAAVQAYREKEIADVQAAEEARRNAFYEQFTH